MEDGKIMVKILYEDNHVLVVLKPVNMPICEDISGDLDLLSYLKSYLKKKYNKPGNVYLALLHRLDRPVGGVVVFAKTSKAAGRLSDDIRCNRVIRKYYAVLCGNISDSGRLIDKLYKDEKRNMVFVSDDGKECILDYNFVSCINNYSFVDVSLVTGRSHQIRVQFSSRGFPLYGDQKYNKGSRTGEQIALFSYYLSFVHPVTKELLEFKCDLPNRVPFNYFMEVIYGK